MKVRSLLVAALLAALTIPTPAAADTLSRIDVIFDTEASCAFACPIFLDSDGCEKEPTTIPGSWDDIRVTVPDEVTGVAPNLLRFQIRPEVDHDAYICLVVHPGTPDEYYELYACICNAIGEPCRYEAPVGLGCQQTGTVVVQPGQVLVLRAYNWLDVEDCEGSYWWMRA